MKKAKDIDPDILRVAREYVEAQLDIMGKYGHRPVLTVEHHEALVRDCAGPVMALRKLRKADAS